MPFTLVAYSESQDEAGAYATVNPVPDPTVAIAAEVIYVPELAQLLGAYAALGTTAIAAYLDTPSLRRIAYYFISPIQNALVPAGLEAVRIHPLNPVGLVRYEGMKAYAQADPAADEQHTVVVLLADGALEPITGEIFHVRAAASITEAAGVWASGSITLEQSLPSGRYQLVGCRVNCGGNGVAFRLIPVGGGYRPGGFCVNAVEARDVPVQRDGGLGVWFEFDPRETPQLEVLASAAGGVSQEIILDLIKVE